MFQTDSDKDVIFVAEKCAAKSNEITFDQVVIWVSDATKSDFEPVPSNKRPISPRSMPVLLSLNRTVLLGRTEAY